jgi:hypothetical protein
MKNRPLGTRNFAVPPLRCGVPPAGTHWPQMQTSPTCLSDHGCNAGSTIRQRLRPRPHRDGVTGTGSGVGRDALGYLMPSSPRPTSRAK